MYRESDYFPLNCYLSSLFAPFRLLEVVLQWSLLYTGIQEIRSFIPTKADVRSV
jgi:hypothetical protein